MALKIKEEKIYRLADDNKKVSLLSKAKGENNPVPIKGMKTFTTIESTDVIGNVTPIKEDEESCPRYLTFAYKKPPLYNNRTRFCSVKTL